MNTRNSILNSRAGLLVAALVSVAATAWSAEPTTLKDAYKGDFYVGVAINRTIAMGTAVRADNVNRTMEQVNKDIELVKTQFNQISPENDLKWALIQPRPGADGFDFAPADAYVKFGMDNNMYIVGHTLVWHSQTPNWVFQGTAGSTAASGGTAAATSAAPPGTFAAVSAASGAAPSGAAPSGAAARGRGRGFGGGRGGLTGPRATRDELLQRMHDHIATVVGRYKGKIKCWDVVNEAIADGGSDILRSSPWSQIIGPDFIAKAFEFAHEADPDAVLRYNDYSLENPAKRKKLITLIKQLQDQKIPVGAIGTQTHIDVNMTFERIDTELTELETLGLPIHLTELDINGARGGQGNTGADIAKNSGATQGGLVSDADRRQMNAYSALFRALVKHKNSVKVVTFWGANDAVSWRRGGNPLLFNGNDEPKPAFDAVIRAASGEMPSDRQP